MSAPRRQRGKTPDREDRRGGAEYEVGYGRPPKRAQFKPGQSGNPKGRPKGAKNEATIWRSVFNKKVAIREGGRERKVSLLEAMILKFTEAALKGDTKTAAFALNRYRLAEGDSPSPDEPDQDDREVFEAFVRRLETDVIAKKCKE
jgi:hypothetical protein